ncbi:MAG: hypothetical protein L6R42_007991, partial [Xanthoria sp. 1 TBL-2021]
MPPPSGPWTITGAYISRSPSSKNPYSANYSLSRVSPTGLAQKDHFNITLRFSAHTSPYNFTGRITLSRHDALLPADAYPTGPNGEVAISQWDAKDHGAGFEIYGEGRILDVAHGGVEGAECFDM